MPLGNGDVGINLWVEQDGSLVFYVSRTGAWDAYDRLLKLGRIRLTLDPPLWKTGRPFRQELRLGQGDIIIEAGPTGHRTRVRVWVDANRPVVRTEVDSDEPTQARVALEMWRDKARVLAKEEAEATDTFEAGGSVVSEADTLVSEPDAHVTWYHRNETSLFEASLRHQGLGSLAGRLPDPLLHLTFGARLGGGGWAKAGASSLRSVVPSRRHVFQVLAHSGQSLNVADWVQGCQRTWEVEAKRALGSASRRDHEHWWARFWDRSWIQVEGTADAVREHGRGSGVRAPSGGRAADDTLVVTRGWLRQRFMTACAGRGEFPIKFNGSIFTVDVQGKFDPDYRRWGGCYWFQNTRLPYWPMLGAGDFEMMRPLFAMYARMLPLAKERTRLYYGHGGAFFPETMHSWGTYHNGDMGYGWARDGEPEGRTLNKYIRYYWSGGLELSLMMLDYLAYTNDRALWKTSLLPIIDGVLEFYSKHYPREPNGRILFAPAQALETWWETENPMPEVAGLRTTIGRLLRLDPNLVSDSQRADWSRLLAALPPLPRRTLDGTERLLPAESFRTQQNMENPELYAIFPYRAFGVGKPELELGRTTFAKRQFRGNRGWQQDDTQAAYLGLGEEAGKLVADRFRASDPGSRFPAFWGPNFDWIPDQDHGANGQMALQTMLVQSEPGGLIHLFPAWPAGWDVDFRLHAVDGVRITGRLRAGHLDRLNVEPGAARKRLRIHLASDTASHGVDTISKP